MAENKEYILYTHTNAQISTVSAFLADELSLVKGLNKTQFLTYRTEGVTNSKRIWDKYDSIEQTEFASAYQANNLSLLKIGTVLAIPKSNLNRELVSIMGKNQIVEQKDFTTFLTNKLIELQADPNYIPVLSRRIDGYTTLKEKIPEISVWIWMRSLDKILDITPFIESISTSVGESGGSFNMVLAPTTTGTMAAFNKNFLSDGLLHRILKGEVKRSDFFFHKYISQNDVVFIRFEALKLEKDRVSGIINNSIQENQLPGKVYDMIGLVDGNNIASEFSANNVNINISGRDLIKLFQDDNTYYFPVTLTVNLNSNEEEGTALVERTVATGGTYDLLVTKGFRNIRASLEFIINVLSNIEIVPNKLFDFYKDKSERFNTGDGSDLEGEPLNGIWQIVKLVIDQSVAGRILADDSFSMPDGDLQDLLTKVCQKPFVEYMVDTYGDQWYITVRRPPFNKEAILDYIDNGLVIDIEESDIIQEDISWNINNIYSWFRINFQSITFAAGGSETLGDLIPAIFFSEYAKIWGNKKLEIVNNYIPAMSYNLTGATAVDDFNYIIEQALEDYKFVIENHLYMPFTRQGNLTIIGDRRIKRGTFVRHKGTDEIYYVNSVSNSYSVGERNIDRTTTLELIRGMKEAYIKGVSKSILTDAGYRKQKVGYFEIADISLIKNYFYDRLVKKDSNEQVGVQLYRNFQLNQDIFNFFLQRKQFDE